VDNACNTLRGRNGGRDATDGGKAGNDFGAEPTDTFDLGCPFCSGGHQCSSCGNDACDVVGAASTVAFLTPAKDEWFDVDAFTLEHDATALRATELV